jgi:hypothetical protein
MSDGQNVPPRNDLFNKCLRTVPTRIRQERLLIKRKMNCWVTLKAGPGDPARTVQLLSPQCRRGTVHCCAASPVRGSRRPEYRRAAAVRHGHGGLAAGWHAGSSGPGRGPPGTSRPGQPCGPLRSCSAAPCLRVEPLSLSQAVRLRGPRACQ